MNLGDQVTTGTEILVLETEGAEAKEEESEPASAEEAPEQAEVEAAPEPEPAEAEPEAAPPATSSTF